jgi:hypothetical protein
MGAYCQRAESPFLHLHSTDVTFHTLRAIIIQLTYLGLRGTRGYVCYVSPVTTRRSPEMFLLESDITKFTDSFSVCIDLHAVSISIESCVHRQQYLQFALCYSHSDHRANKTIVCSFCFSSTVFLLLAHI